MFGGIDGHIDVSGGIQSLREGQNLFGRVFCEGRVEQGSEPSIPEAPDSVRGLTRVQYPPKVIEKGY